MWGIIPAAGRGTRIQPLAFSKELLPVGSRMADGVERPCAVSEYLLERMILGGVDKLCFVISPGKSDILEYFGGKFHSASIAYVVQSEPRGLCDAVFCAHAVVGNEEPIIVGLPDTIWHPADALLALPDDLFSFLLFPVDRPEFFDAVSMTENGSVTEIQVKQPHPSSHWIWGAFKFPAPVFHQLRALWQQPGRRDEYIGTLVNAYLAAGGQASGVKAGASYIDVGTFHGYHAAMSLLRGNAADATAGPLAHELNAGARQFASRRRA
jgi:dTDP-glucose pyrophosphorylase